MRILSEMVGGDAGERATKVSPHGAVLRALAKAGEKKLKVKLLMTDVVSLSLPTPQGPQVMPMNGLATIDVMGFDEVMVEVPGLPETTWKGIDVWEMRSQPPGANRVHIFYVKGEDIAYLSRESPIAGA